MFTRGHWTIQTCTYCSFLFSYLCSIVLKVQMHAHMLQHCHSYFISILGISAFAEVCKTFILLLYHSILSYVYSTLLVNPWVYNAVVLLSPLQTYSLCFVFVFSPSSQFLSVFHFLSYSTVHL